MGALVVLAAQAGSIEPGAEAETVVLVRNTGETADVFHVVVQGAASAWAVVDPPTLHLGPGEEAPAWVHFRPPRSSGTPPGAVPFAVAVASSTDPDFIAVESGDLHIGTFSSIAAAFTGEPNVGAMWIELPISIRNTGNRRVSVEVEVEAASGVAVDVDPPKSILDPGQPAVSMVRVRPPRRLVPRRREDRRLTVSVVSDGGALATLRTEYPADPSLVNELIRSARVLGVLLILLFVGGVALLRSESTSATVDVTEGGQALPTELPSADPPQDSDGATPETAIEQLPAAEEPLPPVTAAVAPSAAGPPTLPRMVFVRAYGPNQRDLVVRQGGARPSELRLRADGALESRPRLSPTGDHVAFIRQRDDSWRVCVVPVQGGDAVCIADSSADGAVGWAADGDRVLFSRAGTLFSVPYSPATEEVGPEVDTGVAVPGGAFASSPDGTRIVLAEGRRLLVRQVDGSGSTSIEVARPASEVSFSPDGQRLLYTSEFQLHVVGVGGGAVRQLTRPGTVNGEGTWVGAGDWVVFRSNRSGGGDLYAVKASASGGDERELAQVTTTPEREITPSF